MAQFKAYRLANGLRVIDLQADFVRTPTRMVAPLIPLAHGPRVISILEPIVESREGPLVVHTAEMAAVPGNLLVDQFADFSEKGDELKRALDLLYFGI